MSPGVWMKQPLGQANVCSLHCSDTDGSLAERIFVCFTNPQIIFSRTGGGGGGPDPGLPGKTALKWK